MIIAHSARRGVGSAVKVLRQAEARLLASRGRLAQVGTVIFARAAWLNLDRASLVDAADLEEARACSARKALLGAVAPAVQREPKRIAASADESVNRPRIRLSAPIKILLPAPVSPVIILSLSEKLMSISSIIA